MDSVDAEEIRKAIVLQATRKLCKVHVKRQRVVDVKVAGGILYVRFIGLSSWHVVQNVTID